MLQNIVILSLIIWGVAQLFDEGMILGGIGERIQELSPATRWMLKPVILCPPCMASLWGLSTALALGYDIQQTLVLIFATAGLNYIIANK
jgi:hypothetical protein